MAGPAPWLSDKELGLALYTCILSLVTWLENRPRLQPRGYGAVLDMGILKFTNNFGETKQNYRLESKLDGGTEYLGR